MRGGSLAARRSKAIVAVTRAGRTPQNRGRRFLVFTHRCSRGGSTAGSIAAIAGGDVFSFVTQQLTTRPWRFQLRHVSEPTPRPSQSPQSNDIVFDIGLCEGLPRLRVPQVGSIRTIGPSSRPHRCCGCRSRWGVRHYLSTRGRSIGRFAWIPAARGDLRRLWRGG